MVLNCPEPDHTLEHEADNIMTEEADGHGPSLAISKQT